MDTITIYTEDNLPGEPAGRVSGGKYKHLFDAARAAGVGGWVQFPGGKNRSSTAGNIRHGKYLGAPTGEFITTTRLIDGERVVFFSLNPNP